MREKGLYAEEIAAKYLQTLGYKIVERNFHCYFGEIDIIAQHKEYLVFIEVKLRKNNNYGGAAAAIDKRKQEKIKKTATYYLWRKHIEPYVRFDAVLITNADGKIKKKDIEVIEAAFF